MANIVHVADIDINPTSGMGRVGFHWKQAFENSGHTFTHIGKNEVGKLSHPAKFPSNAKTYFQKHFKGKVDIILAHEPVSGIFKDTKIPVALFSHGLEQREWELRNREYKDFYDPVSLKSRILFPLWRLRYCNLGLKNSRLLLLSNSEDKNFAINRYNRSGEDIVIFKNGIYPKYFRNLKEGNEALICTIAFNGTWIKRKGIDVLVKAAQLLYERGLNVKWFLFGVVFPKHEILTSFPHHLHDSIEILSTYPLDEERDLYNKADIFVLPSFFEGQSLALLQAMASQLCCITSACCAQLDLIINQQNGLLFPPGDAQALASQIQLAVENKPLRKRLAANAQISVESLNWDSASNEVVKRVESMI